MSDRDDVNTSLGTFLKNFSVPILTVFSFIFNVYNFIKLFANKDAGLITLISLGVGILLLLCICLYYARFWKPEQQDKGQSFVQVILPKELERTQTKKGKRRKWIRGLAVTGLILIPILSVSGFVSWKYSQSPPPNNIIVLVANFDGPNPSNYRITENIIEKLKDATKDYGDVQVQALEEEITLLKGGSKAARSLGKKHHASIVLWGWYGKTPSNVQVSTHFEILQKPHFLLLRDDKQILKTAVATLDNFQIQTQLSSDMSYLTLLVLGLTRYEAKDYNGAIVRFTDALNQETVPKQIIDPAVLFFYRGTAYSKIDELNRAIDDYNEAVQFQPRLFKAILNRGVIYLRKGEVDLAISDFNRTIQDRPFFVPAFLNRGLAYSQKDELKQAIKDYNRAIKLKPSDGLAYAFRGDVYIKMEKLSSAIKDYNKAIKLKPEDAFIFSGRGRAYIRKGKTDLAMADYKKAIRLSSGDTNVYASRGHAYLEQDEFDLAIADFDKAIQFKPEDAFIYSGRGDAYLQKGELDLAMEDYNRAIQLKPKDALMYSSRGNGYLQKGEFDLAMADYNRAIQLKPKNAFIYSGRGHAYLQKGELDLAMADFEKAIQLKPRNALIYSGRGDVYLQKGEFDLAMADYNRAIKLKPKNALMYSSRQGCFKLHVEKLG